MTSRYMWPPFPLPSLTWLQLPLLLADPPSFTSAPPRERAEEACTVTGSLWLDHFLTSEAQCALTLSIALVIRVRHHSPRKPCSPEKSSSATQTVLQWHKQHHNRRTPSPLAFPQSVGEAGGTATGTSAPSSWDCLLPLHCRGAMVQPPPPPLTGQLLGKLPFIDPPLSILVLYPSLRFL